MPQTNTVTIKYRFHYRYQMVQEGSDYVPVTFGQPSVFIDCKKTQLQHFSWNAKNPIPDQINDKNRPNTLTQNIATGRIEDREGCIITTLSLTVLGSLSFVVFMYFKWSNSKIYVY